jgi:hypothetical protein
MAKSNPRAITVADIDRFPPHVRESIWRQLEAQGSPLEARRGRRVQDKRAKPATARKPSRGHSVALWRPWALATGILVVWWVIAAVH